MYTRIVTTILTDAFARLSAGDGRGVISRHPSAAIAACSARLLRPLPDIHPPLRRAPVRRPLVAHAHTVEWTETSTGTDGFTPAPRA